jgi:hypothetical protein
MDGRSGQSENRGAEDATDLFGGSDVLPPSVLELDHVYEALAHPRRRYLCCTLLEDTEWPLTELATKVAAWENSIPEYELTDEKRDMAYVSLYHAHVPKLVDLGVLSFDEDHETITADETADQVLAAPNGVGASLDSTQETHARSQIDEEN